MSTLTIDIDINGLAVNTILESAQLDGNFNVEFQAHTEDDVDKKAPKITPGSSSDEMVACSRAFKVLKSIVTRWYVDFTNKKKKSESF